MKSHSFQIAIMALITALFSALPLYSSEQSDAQDLRQRSEKESKSFEVCVTNFGDETDKSGYLEGMKMLKLGKLKIIQSRFKEAIGIYNEYLRLQRGIYESLAKKYLARTRKINDEIAEEFVDAIDRAKVDDYFKLAYRSLEDAKKVMAGSNPVLVIETCRRSKKYSLGVYGLQKKPLPDKYKTDAADADGTIPGK